MSAKHTPGPWAVCQNPPNSQWHAGITIGEASPGGRRICDLALLATAEVNAANGALIEAAPDLLALAHQYADECAHCGGTSRVWINPTNDPQDDVDHPCPECADIWAVIEKAEGVSPPAVNATHARESTLPTGLQPAFDRIFGVKP